MFLPESKYNIKDTVESGMSFVTEAGEAYVGKYIEDYLGNCYSGTDLKGAQNRLIKVASKLTIQLPIPKPKKRPEPTEEDYASGSYIRYFKQNNLTKKVQEIKAEDVKDNKGCKITQSPWILTGSLDDQFIGNYIYSGVRSKNQEFLNKLEEEIPGIVKSLDLTPEEFVKESNASSK